MKDIPGPVESVTEKELSKDKSFLKIFSYFGDDKANTILQDIENPKSNYLRELSANETRPVVPEHCSTFEDFQDRFMNKESAIGLAFRGQASAEWRLNSSLFRLWTKLKVPDDRGISMRIDHFISRAQDLAKERLNYNRQNPDRPPDNDYLMAVLQHYREMSPLLDWTLNMDYALYFAFAGAPAIKSKKVAIYIADIGKVNNLALRAINHERMGCSIDTMLAITLDAVKRTGGGWAFFRPAHFGDIRFALQAGVFAYQHATDFERYLSVYNSWSGNDFAVPGTLWIVTLPVSERPAVMKHLAENHVTHEMLFAGWDEIGRDIVSKYTDEQIRELQSRRCVEDLHNPRS